MAVSAFDLTDKVVVITGGAGVLASAISRGLAEYKARIACLDRNVASTDALMGDLKVLGCHAIGVTTDALDRGALEVAVGQVLDTFGRIDVLINAAGGNKPEATASPDSMPFFDLPAEALQWVFNLNFLTAVLASQVCGKVMARQGHGVIVNISSMAAFRPMTRVLAYAASKAAISNFTQWLAVHMAQEYSPDIRVNALAPGFFLGKQNRYLLIDEATGALTPRGQQIIAHTPMGRFGQPDELVGTVAWLISDASRFVTGIVVPVDGGFSAYSGV